MFYKIILLLICSFPPTLLLGQAFNPIDNYTVEYWQKGAKISLAGDPADSVSVWQGYNGKQVVQTNTSLSPILAGEDTIRFNTAGDYLAMSANDTDFDIDSSNFTIDCYFKYISDAGGIVAKDEAYSTATPGWMLRCGTVTGSDARINFYLSDGTNLVQCLLQTSDINVGGFYLITGVVDWDADSAMVYINGVKYRSASQCLSNAGINSITTTIALTFGNSGLINDDWGGDILYVRISNKARTQAETLQFYNNPDVPTTATQSGFSKFSDYKNWDKF